MTNFAKNPLISFLTAIGVAMLLKNIVYHQAGQDSHFNTFSSEIHPLFLILDNDKVMSEFIKKYEM